MKTQLFCLLSADGDSYLYVWSGSVGFVEVNFMILSAKPAQTPPPTLTPDPWPLLSSDMIAQLETHRSYRRPATALVT